jgi:integrase/recombinase XerD
MGELIKLKMDHVYMNEGLLKVMGKGKKERIVPMGSNAQKALHRYLFRYRPQPFSKSTDNVFLSVVGQISHQRWRCIYPTTNTGTFYLGNGQALR